MKSYAKKKNLRQNQKIILSEDEIILVEAVSLSSMTLQYSSSEIVKRDLRSQHRKRAQTHNGFRFQLVYFAFI